MNASIRRRRAASVAGFARIEQADPDELATSRQRGGETRGAQLQGDAAWGRTMAAAKALKRNGGGPTNEQRIAALESRLERIESVLQREGGERDERDGNRASHRAQSVSSLP